MDRKTFLKKAGVGTAGLIGASFACSAGPLVDYNNNAEQPNIMIILADDMGFSDIGCYGGEVETPNVNRLAANGIKFTQFYNAARCCPTRASLQTGLYPHQAGVGGMVSDHGYPGYRGNLNNHCVTIAEVLRRAGYSTYMSGKWHLTRDMGEWTGSNQTSKHDWPIQRGYDRFFGTITGAGSYYNPPTLTKGNTPIEPAVDDFYYADRITDYAIQHIKDHFSSDNNQPFFSYVAYTSPHWPLHALEKDIKKYQGRYDVGWDRIREERLQKMREIGLLDPKWKLTKRDPRVPSWEQATNKAWETRRMEVYAAQIDRMDQGVGRIIQTLKQHNQLDNTLVLFLSDNGGCAEILTDIKGHSSEVHLVNLNVPKKTRQGKPVVIGNNPHIMPGPADTYQSYGIGWANVSDTPFRLYKHYVHEGGISTPLIAHWPSGIQIKGKWRREPAYLIDIMATCVDVAGAQYPDKFKGNKIYPMEGESLVPVFDGGQLNRGRAIYWEHTGNRAIRDGKWKLEAQRHKKKWELYDMEADRTETNNLAKEHPAKVRELYMKYQDWAARVGVIPLPLNKT